MRTLGMFEKVTTLKRWFFFIYIRNTSYFNASKLSRSTIGEEKILIHPVSSSEKEPRYSLRQTGQSLCSISQAIMQSLWKA
mmetsp:Transcript_2501/g.3378  ORF Transcript_2501/g.3378 Transcript_2501/m.3378 type:complete len:81 (+) Transcript_2501:124-366(+)